jgi:hypothetical protein
VDGFTAALDACEDPAGVDGVVLLGWPVTMPLLLCASTLDAGAEGSELGTPEEPGMGVVLVLTTTVENSVVVPEMVDVVVGTEEIWIVFVLTGTD